VSNIDLIRPRCHAALAGLMCRRPDVRATCYVLRALVSARRVVGSAFGTRRTWECGVSTARERSRHRHRAHDKPRRGCPHVVQRGAVDECHRRSGRGVDHADVVGTVILIQWTRNCSVATGVSSTSASPSLRLPLQPPRFPGLSHGCVVDPPTNDLSTPWTGRAHATGSGTSRCSVTS
jgi:hypothetical protein